MELIRRSDRRPVKISHLIIAELVITEGLCTLSGNVHAQKSGNVTPAQSRVMEKMMRILHDELERPLLDGGWRSTTEKLASSASPAPQSNDRKAGARQVETRLYFGNWTDAEKGTKMMSSIPVTVNMVLHIRSSPETAAHIMKKIDWRKIEGALTS
jgi:hypothetical protein